MHAFLIDADAETITKVEFDGTDDAMCQILGLPEEQLRCCVADFCRTFGGDDVIIYLKERPDDGTEWFWGDFDSRVEWDVPIIDRALIVGQGVNEEFPRKLKPASPKMSIEEVWSHVSFRPGMVCIDMMSGPCVAIAGPNASPATRAMVDEINATLESKELRNELLGEVCTDGGHDHH